jgi:hypothetical protein
MVAQGPLHHHASFVLLGNTQQEKVIAIQDERERERRREGGSKGERWRGVLGQEGE